MKKTISLLCLILGLSFVLPVSGDARSDRALYEIYGKRESVNIHVAQPTDATGQKLDLGILKEAFERALKDRVSINFNVSQNASDADLTVQCEILEYTWSDEDPLDMLMGAGGAAYDAAVIEHYSKIRANVTLYEKSKTGPAWSGRLKASVTDGEMKQEDGFMRASEKMAKVFLKEAFGKKKAKKLGRR